MEFLPIQTFFPEGEGTAEETYGRLKQLSVSRLSCIYEDGRGYGMLIFSFIAGELLVLTGPVASGKSSILNALFGIVPASFQEILWNGKEVQNLFTLFKAPTVSCCLQSSSSAKRHHPVKTLTLGRNISDIECWKALQSAVYGRGG